MSTLYTAEGRAPVLIIVSSIPANVMFEIDDIEEGWTWSKPFDYMHSRMMNSNIGDWDEYVAQAYE